MHIDLKDLKLFIAIAEEENLTRGAKRAYLTAPAASARIKALEEVLGAKLLYRGNKGVSLTLAGERFLHHARLIQRQLDYLREDFSERWRDRRACPYLCQHHRRNRVFAGNFGVLFG